MEWTGLAWMLDSRSSVLAYGTRRVTSLHLCLFWQSLPSVAEDASGVVDVKLSASFIGVQVSWILGRGGDETRGGQDMYAGFHESKLLVVSDD